jgi:hypothetical protein
MDELHPDGYRGHQPTTDPKQIAMGRAAIIAAVRYAYQAKLALLVNIKLEQDMDRVNQLSGRYCEIGASIENLNIALNGANAPVWTNKDIQKLIGE